MSRRVARPVYRRSRRGACALLAVVIAGAAAGCREQPAATEPEVVLAPAGGVERPVVFEAGELVYAQRSAIHVGERVLDVSPGIVQSMDWTPYGLFLRSTEDPIRGPVEDAFFDGTTLTPIEDVYGPVLTSSDGELAAWIDRSGPVRPAGRVARVVVVEVPTGRVVFSSAQGMGGEAGDDLGDRYEELPPAVLDLTGERVVWVDSQGSGETITSDLATGRSRPSPWRRGPGTSGYTFASPDGRYRVDATRTGRLRVSPRQPDFGHRWQTQGGWLGDHVMLALGQDRFAFSYDPTVPDTTPGYLLACDLAAGDCEQLAEVVGARDVVFPGIDVSY